MQYTRESATERLLKNYEPYYDIHRMINGDQAPDHSSAVIFLSIPDRCMSSQKSGNMVRGKRGILISREYSAPDAGSFESFKE